jgi:carboxyl-terminal processing protease
MISRAPAILAGFLLAAAAWAAPALSPRQQGEDFDAAWRAIDEGYAYFDSRRPAWKRARDKWRPRAARASTHAEFVAALEGALAELRDESVTIDGRSPGSARRIPYDTDIAASWTRGAATIEAVRTFGDADVAGVRPGLVVTKVQGVPIERLLREFPDWTLRRVLAGPRNGEYRIEARDGARSTAFTIERGANINGTGTPPIVGRRMGQDRDIGYLRVRVGHQDERIAEAFDGALNYLKDTRALIVDLRENAGPGSRATTLALLAKFADGETPWQVRANRAGVRTIDTVRRGRNPYRNPVLVLVDRWTAGEGEALAAGLSAVAHARIVGTRTAGLHGEPREVTLRHSGIVVRFPGERVFLVSGAPREALEPDVPVDVVNPAGGPGDPILYQALKLLDR